MRLSPSDLILFQQMGIVRMPGFISKSAVESARDTLISEIDRLKRQRKGSLLNRKEKELHPFQQILTLTTMIQPGPKITGLFPQDLTGLMSELARGRVAASHPFPQLLLSPPNQSTDAGFSFRWHLDAAVPPHDICPGVQIFVLIDDLQPGGGGTLALAGSHRLPYVSGFKSAHEALRSDSFFAELYAPIGTPSEKFFVPRTVHGIEVSLIEMSGRAGDAFVMDMRVLHSPSPNRTSKMRMMATARYLRA